MVRHDDGGVQVDCPIVSAEAGFENDSPCLVRKYPAVVSAESDEMRFIVALQVREVATIKILRHWEMTKIVSV